MGLPSKQIRPDVSNRIGNKKLIRLVANEIDYNLYEVEDMLEGMRRVITRALSEGKEIRIEHLFSLVPKVNPSRPYVSPKGEHKVSDGSVSCMIRLTKYLKDSLNGRVTEALSSEDTDEWNKIFGEVEQEVEEEMVFDAEPVVQSMHENTIQPKSRRKFTAKDQRDLF